MSTKQKWLTYAIVGLLTIGFGLSLLGEAIIIKLNASDNWFLWGTSALVIFNSGVCLFGQAVIEKTKI